ncbi:MAG: hypothetical protein QM627_07715 [Luteolibacter sp.]
MSKRIAYIAAALLILTGWGIFALEGWRIHSFSGKIERLVERGDPEEEVESLQERLHELEGRRVLKGVLLVIFTATAGGVFFVVEVLPRMASRMVDSIYGSGEEWDMPEPSEAVALVARGEFEEAIGIYRKQTEEEPENLMPWLEIAKIQRVNLGDPEAAVRTLKEAAAGKNWPEEKSVLLAVRLAEIHRDDLDDPQEGKAVLRRVIEAFPGSRQTVRARQMLDEWEEV